MATDTRPGDRLQAKLATITDEDLADFCERRYKLLTSEPGHICTPFPQELAHMPFADNEYAHRELVGSLFAGAWPEICAMDPKVLLHPNPFELSALRKPYKLEPGPDENPADVQAYRIWDATIGVPACYPRSGRTRHIRDIPSSRKINEFWLHQSLPALHHVGPLGPEGAVVRPTGALILDLTRSAMGWQILEAAHVLAHLRGDDKPPDRDFAEILGQTAGRFVQAVTEIWVSIYYDLPLDVSRKDCGKPGDPDTYFLTEVKSSSEFVNPVIRLPWMNREAPRLDSTLSVLLTSVHYEPHPYGYNMRTNMAGPSDHWCCMPTIVAIAGWEGIDYVTHQPLGTLSDRPKAPVDYVVRAEDLLPPDTYWYYLALALRAKDAQGRPLFERPWALTGARAERWQYFSEWIKTPAYGALRARTPPLPCRSCMTLNKHTEGAPLPPKDIPLRGAKAKKHPLVKKWTGEITKIYNILLDAVTRYESAVWYRSVTQAARTRRARKATWNKYIAVQREHVKARELWEKTRKRSLTSAEQTWLRNYKLRYPEIEL